MKRQGIAEALRDGITEEMQRDKRVFCIGEDIGVPGGPASKRVNPSRLSSTNKPCHLRIVSSSIGIGGRLVSGIDIRMSALATRCTHLKTIRNVSLSA